MAIAAAGAFMAANATAITTAVSVASAAHGFMQQRQQAAAAQEYQKKQNEAAINSMQNQYGQLSEPERQAHRRSVEETMNAQEEYAKRKSSINLMAAASGTAGLSVDSMMTDLSTQNGRNLETIVRNQENELAGFRQQAEQIRLGAANRIDNRKIQRPSWLEGGLKVGAAALTGYSTGQDIKAKLGQGGDPAATFQQDSYGDLNSRVNYTQSNQVYGGV